MASWLILKKMREREKQWLSELESGWGEQAVVVRKLVNERKKTLFSDCFTAVTNTPTRHLHTRGVPEYKYIIQQSTNSVFFMNICFIQIFLKITCFREEKKPLSNTSAQISNITFSVSVFCSAVLNEGSRIHLLHDAHFLIWASLPALRVFPRDKAELLTQAKCFQDTLHNLLLPFSKVRL